MADNLIRSLRPPEDGTQVLLTSKKENMFTVRPSLPRCAGKEQRTREGVVTITFTVIEFVYPDGFTNGK